MVGNVIYEFCRRQWNTSSCENGKTGFSYEIKDDGLYAYHGYYDRHHEDHPYTFDVCHFSPHQLQGLLRYIQEEQPGIRDKAALSLLITHLQRSAEKPLVSHFPAGLGGFVLLAAVVSILVLLRGKVDIEDSFLPLYVNAATITIPLFWLIMQLACAREWLITRACGHSIGASADQVCQKLHSIEPQVKMTRFQAVSRPLLLVLIAWLVIAIVIIFL